MDHRTQTAVARVVYGWMLERGYMVDPDDDDHGPVADRVETWDAQDLIDRLHVDGFEVVEHRDAA